MFKPPQIDKSIFMVMMLASAMAQAENMSVGEMIAKNKAIRAAELMGVQPPKEGGKPVKIKITLIKPKVWSISGINDDMQAVLLYEQRAYRIKSQQLPTTIGPWQVTSIKGQQVWLREAKKSGMSQQIVWVDGPDRDMSVDEYAKEMNIQYPWEDSDINVARGGSQISQLAAQPAPLPPSAMPMRRFEPIGGPVGNNK